MQSMSCDLNELSKRLNDIAEEFPEKNRELHIKLGGTIKSIVNSKIGGTGKVRGWQKVFIGSKGGYAAVRSISTMTGNKSPGAITNYVNSGHKIRPHRSSKRYYSRINVAYVNGKRFYEKSVVDSESELIKAAEEFAQQIADDLGRTL